ncbi:hypothetical protein BDP27DRAFT_1419071 [Rhodocollybia butyracea]|uniref:Uncharacterized protein n=1 Tax=Rhodocollybia butyracea TaxID=206335 RepID=A0A9P5UAW7_9AGAR|nr:hypothetical protein BDP27DRAFT_1419071 [Rhodocollybia butyracea]
MLLTHHWLGFILLAVLISPACAAPLERRNVHYHMTLVDINGLEVETIQIEAKDHLHISITSLAKEMGDGGVPTVIDHSPDLLDIDTSFSPTTMLYYRLKGGKHCSRSADKATLITCFGFVVSSPKDKDHPAIMFGTVISCTVDEKGHSFHVFHQPIPAGITGEQLKRARELEEDVYFDFLTKFVLIKQWVMWMDQGKGNQAPDPVVKRAAAAFRSEYEQKMKAHREQKEMVDGMNQLQVGQKASEEKKRPREDELGDNNSPQSGKKPKTGKSG